VDRLHNARILIYSHDSFGLGHLRRCRAIAHAIVDRYKGVSVLILSGSPIIGSFDFLPRVDFVRIPGVVKLTNGEYQSLGLHIDLQQTMAIRAAIIEQTAASFRPDLFLVDKEPLGLEGEATRTLRMLRRAAPASCWACATSWTIRSSCSASGSASGRCRRSRTSTTTSGCMALPISPTRCRASPARRPCARR
jgi:predicted glycosyltransferase